MSIVNNEEKKNKKNDDLVLCLCSIFAGMLFMFTSMGCVHTGLDVFIWLGTIFGFFVIPIFWHSFKYKIYKK